MIPSRAGICSAEESVCALLQTRGGAATEAPRSSWGGSVSGGHTKHQPLPQAATQAFVACGLSRVGPRRAGTGEPTACVLGVEELREGDEYELVREEREVAEEDAVLAAGCQWHEFWWEHP